MFFRASGVEARIVRNVLGRYENLSGQAINFNKSSVIFSPNTRTRERNQVCQILQVSEVSEPGRYLGMPMNVGKKKVSVFHFLTDRVKKKLQSWGTKLISKGGKCTLLKTAAQTIPNFWMNLFLIPNEVCESMEVQINGYWWGHGQNNKGIRWKNWDKLCVMKEAGRLGFKKLRNFNISMLAKQAWLLINNDNPLVTTCMKAKYIPGRDFLTAKLGANPSYMWRSILAAQEVVKRGCRRRICDGKQTEIGRFHGSHVQKMAS
ncbi:putative mitochondrial protein AtMg00310 [Apium graveolens]|uniref:putative mitochondrial protein AtMg00310 n=1 Tax=Apium graveolens TaxID=4045 RepID=UPI003D7BB44B